MEQLEADLSRARRGDDAAFGRIYDRYAPVVLALCRRRGGGGAVDAEDAMQEAFIRAHAKLDEVHGAEKLGGWLYGIARRVCSEQARAQRRRRHHEGTAMTMRTTEHDGAALLATALDRAHDDERLHRLTGALGALTDDERLAVHLYYLDADPVRAAASVLGLSRSGYYKLLKRARTNLEHLMREVRSA